MPVIDFGALFPDPRANRLEHYQLRRRKDGTRSFVLLRGCEEIVTQVVDLFGDRNPERLHPQPPVVPADSEVRWTHVIAFDGSVTGKDRSALDLLSQVLTLRPVRELDLGLGLDFYKLPPDEADDRWRDTEVGALVNKKYWTSRPDLRREAGGTLADKLTSVASSHPRYSRATYIVAIPGTNHDFGERLARGVAKRLDLPVCTAACGAEHHRAAKEGHLSYELESYLLPAPMRGQVVLVVDDVWRTGRTMRSVAAATKAEGATETLGLVAARTMRNY